jgi:hypothetical protein
LRTFDLDANLRGQKRSVLADNPITASISVSLLVITLEGLTPYALQNQRSSSKNGVARRNRSFSFLWVASLGRADAWEEVLKGK